MLMIVAYDITDPRRLAKVAKVCEDYGVRVQYSVFECRLEADQFQAFWETIKKRINPEEDRLIAYRICAGCAKDVLTAGTMITTKDNAFITYVF